MNNYTDLLRRHNLKATPQRLAITDILQTHGHVSIELLYEIMLQKFNSISLATIYKNINIMLDNAFVQEVKIPNTKSVFELTKETHSHLVCEVCGSIQDIRVDLTKVMETQTDFKGFKVNTASVVFTGVCRNCKN